MTYTPEREAPWHLVPFNQLAIVVDDQCRIIEVALVFENAFMDKTIRKQRTDEIQHGTMAGYRKCRCDACLAAGSAYNRAVAARRRVA